MEFSGLLEVSGILIICLAFPNVPLFQDCFKICFFLGGGDLLPCYGAVGILSLSSKMGIFWGF